MLYIHISVGSPTRTEGMKPWNDRQPDMYRGCETLKWPSGHHEQMVWNIEITARMEFLKIPKSHSNLRGGSWDYIKFWLSQTTDVSVFEKARSGTLIQLVDWQFCCCLTILLPKNFVARWQFCWKYFNYSNALKVQMWYKMTQRIRTVKF